MRLGFYSPAWPGRLVANGIATATFNLVSGLRALGHTAVVVADRLEEQSVGAFETDARSPWTVKDKIAYHLGMRHPVIATNRRAIVQSIQRIVSEAMLDAFFMEESFGHAAAVQAALDVPVGVFLHGPYFIHKTVSPLETGSLLNKGRQFAEGEAVRNCYAVISLIPGRAG